MPEADDYKSDSPGDNVKRIVAKATEHAKFKSARLKKLKERNELYLAARRLEFGLDDDDDYEDDITRELRIEP